MVVGLAILVVMSVLLLRGPRVNIPTFLPLTFAQGNIMGGRFSADGQSVIYGASWVGQPPQIYSTRPGNPESGSLGLSNTIWSVSSPGEMAWRLKRAGR